ncbi:unnamed protein product [Ceutorhynchus assimilis]|uniref:Swi5-dependent recombination DNA repair protein 1 homolog n=1 Tax=Ceutorhynchus assimilis TaxID=467358 RepID=A0A9N9MGK5_9CUCU|nr:unnamed protein product [Ceutorhynchus assimilis]
MPTPKESKSNTKDGKDPNHHTTPKNYITSGIGKHFLTPCRRIGLSRKTPNSNALDIFKAKNDGTSTPTPKSSIITEQDIISTPINRDKLSSVASKSRTNNDKDIACTPNNLDDTPKPEPKSKGKARTSVRTKKIIACDAVEIDNIVHDSINVTPAAKIGTLDIPKENKNLADVSIKESEPKKNTRKSLKKPIKKTKNNNNNDELRGTNDKKKLRVSVQKSDSCSDLSDEDFKPSLKLTSRKRNRINSDSDSDDLPLKSLIETEAEIHDPPVKRCIDFNEQKSDESDFKGFKHSPNTKKLIIKINNSTKTKKPDAKRIIPKKTFSTEDSDDEMFTSTPDEDKKQSENLLELVTSVEKEVKQKEDLLEKLKQAEVYRKRHCPEKLQQSIDLWLKGCNESLDDLLIIVQKKGPRDMNMLLKELHISDEIAAKLKAK